VRRPAVAPLLLLAAFVSGFATMAVEVLWVRYLAFSVPNTQYSFTGILGVLLLAFALGSLLYNVFLAHRDGQAFMLGVIEMALAPVTLLALMLGAWAVMGNEGGPSYLAPRSGPGSSAQRAAPWGLRS